MKLLLRIQPDLVNIEDSTGLTPLEVAKEKGHDFCVELVSIKHMGLKIILETLKKIIKIILEFILIHLLYFLTS